MIAILQKGKDSSAMSTDTKTYEVRKTIVCTNHMQLIDLNGTRKNFQSDFIVQTTKPNQTFKACVITQDQLDNGDIQFETCTGKFARRVTYQQNKHLNHYIAIRNSPEDDSEPECSVVARLTELPAPQPEPVPEPEVIKENIDQNTREVLENQLSELSTDPTYQNMPDELPEPTNASVGIAENDDIIIPGIAQPSSSFGWKWNIWTMVGVGCLILVFLLWWRRRGKGKSSRSLASTPSTVV